MCTNRRPLGRWKGVAKEYMYNKCVKWGELEQARREYLVRERWRLFCCGQSHRRHSRREKGI